jgi:starch phosphorylase
VAGKAHPNDEAARDLLARVARAARTDEFAGRVVVVEDYDIDLARALVSGVDLWLNTPRPPMEASGTSGMKAAANGVLNLSVGDGWWLEAYDGTNGWRIGDPDAAEASDAAVASALYRLLEDEVVPLFFRRDERGVPREWLERCRRSLATIPPAFDAARMAAQYLDEAYLPMARRALDLSRDRHAGARRLAADRARLRRALADVRCEEAVAGGPDGAVPGAPVPVRAHLALGTLRPEELLVECVVGRPSPSGLLDPTPFRLSPTSPGRFEGTVLLPRAGDWGWTLRLRPSSDSSSLHSPVSWP